MKLLPFEVSQRTCPACGSGKGYDSFYCDREHIMLTSRGIVAMIDATTFGHATPHLHLACLVCGYERLTKFYDPEGMMLLKSEGCSGD